jgi:hypothetical protein
VYKGRFPISCPELKAGALDAEIVSSNCSGPFPRLPERR